MEKMGMITKKSLLLAAALTVACATAEEPQDDDVTFRMSINRMSINSLGVGALSQVGYDVTLDKLGPNSATAILASSPEGQELLRYMATCALRQGEELIVVDNSGNKFHAKTSSNLGLFPEWQFRPLVDEERQWLIACLLAHVNAFGIAVPLSLRGLHGALATDPAEESDFPYFEGAFFGDFGAFGNGEDKLYACYGADQLAACGGDPVAAAHAIWNRVCARGGCQNFTVVGQCVDYDGSQQYACETESGGIVSDCHSVASTKKGQWPASDVYNTPVMNSYLKDITCQPD